MLDLSVNVGAYGPPPVVAAALGQADLSRYPDPTSREARSAWAHRLGRAPEELVFGSGAADLLWDLAGLLACASPSVLCVEPAFSEFRAALSRRGIVASSLAASERDGLRFPLEGLASRLDRERFDVVHLDAPTSPAGVRVPTPELAGLAAAHPRTRFVVDISFQSLSESAHEELMRWPPNVVLVRSLTKELGLPGLRVGFLVADAALTGELEAARAAWSTSAHAQAAALAAASPAAQDWVARVRARLLESRVALERSLERVGFRLCARSTSVYTLVRPPDAGDLRAALMARGIRVRECTSFGLPGAWRLRATNTAERARLGAALRDILDPLARHHP
jgi:histidinol-phosphate/aromatic aminotransferase/cobyric acid decarboxylase-like protein